MGSKHSKVCSCNSDGTVYLNLSICNLLIYNTKTENQFDYLGVWVYYDDCIIYPYFILCKRVIHYEKTK